jgi:hypothetical protein
MDHRYTAQLPGNCCGTTPSTVLRWGGVPLPHTLAPSVSNVPRGMSCVRAAPLRVLNADQYAGLLGSERTPEEMEGRDIAEATEPIWHVVREGLISAVSVHEWCSSK